ncbi:hypothetical protein T06_9285 [Trichinella sp. T6]|nr:hypothetical protein T06_9285 [Trichinella sp. T6]
MYEGRAHLLKHTNFDEKKGPVYTNLEVNTVLRTTPHADMTDCRVQWLYAYNGAVLKSCC